jgi:hypothetical protein
MVMGAGAPKNNFQDAGNFQPGVSLAIGTKFSHRLKWPVTSKTPGILSPSAQKIRRVTNGTFISLLQGKKKGKTSVMKNIQNECKLEGKNVNTIIYLVD